MPWRRMTFSNTSAGPVGNLVPRSNCEDIARRQFEIVGKHRLTRLRLLAHLPDLVAR